MTAGLPRGISMKSKFSKMLLAIIVAASLSFIPAAADNTSYITENGVKLERPETSRVEGHVRISGSTTQKKIKLLVVGADKQVWYEIKLDSGKFNEEIWFDSPGKYTIRVMVNEYDRKYSYGPGITLENTEELNQYLIPEKHIESNDAAIIDTARRITKGYSGGIERVKAIYEWVIDNMEYDYDKLYKHSQGKYDNQYGAVNAIKTKRGVCYDYSTLTAALARSLGIQAKVVEGNLSKSPFKGFHAWNEVFIPELDSWISIDTTLGDTTGESYFDFEKHDEN